MRLGELKSLEDLINPLTVLQGRCQAVKNLSIDRWLFLHLVYDPG
jgi:hypothetical protein